MITIGEFELDQLHIAEQEAEAEYIAAAEASCSPHPDDLIVWPDGTYCYRHELAEFSHMSDDYNVHHADDCWMYLDIASRIEELAEVQF